MGISNISYTIALALIVTSFIVYHAYHHYKSKHEEYKAAAVKYEENRLAKLALTADIGIENDLEPIAKLLLTKIDHLISHKMKEFNNHSVAYQASARISECADDIVTELLEYISKNENKYNSIDCEDIANQYTIMRKIFIKNYSMLYHEILDKCIDKADLGRFYDKHDYI